MTRTKPAGVHFYFDADIRGLGILLSRIRSDVTYPGDPGGEVHKRLRPPCVVTDVATPDDIWIPQVTEQGWLIVTRDRHIRTRSRECVTHGSDADATGERPPTLAATGLGLGTQP
ncbi:hypothetical protein [Micromonospora sp. NBC_01813]|uniref:PIN-like domain-containing protein n=1 Tax=Micromonospora sp. NBC_01813 TaxID=2975988 RepID=UPI002DD7CF56|nr:hypothetical protein [Micromonospora sp. NBC_01813]WSA07359.1 hypothetical protein OG958_24350 [Micromonospora sp. NBC_01813]